MSPREPQRPADLPVKEEAATARSGVASVEALFREHNKTLVRFLASRLSSDAEAKEVAQEAYVRLLQLDQPHAIGFLRAFLFKTASNIATDHLRRRRLAKAAQAAEPFDLDIHQLSPEEEVVSAQEIEIVSSCLAELKPRCRQAVLMYRIDGRSASEVAAELGISTRMVRKYLTQAVLLIRDRLEASHRQRSFKENDHD